MGARKSQSRGLADEIVGHFGLSSHQGETIISLLQLELAARADREYIINQWQQTTGGLGLQYQGAAASLTVKGAANLSPAEILLCRQTYYTMVVQIVAYVYLVGPEVKKDLEIPAMQDLVSGQAFSRLGIANLTLEGFPHWHTANEGDWSQVIADLIKTVQTLNLPGLEKGDLFQQLYEDLIPRQVRHALGEHYTPLWLARHVVDQIGYQGESNHLLLDPCCGSGVFLVEALRRRRLWPQGDGRADIPMVVGMDVNPLAVLTARVNYLIAMDLDLTAHEALEIPVYILDTILEEDEGLFHESLLPGHLRNGCDYVVGNPPWVNWESLSPDYRKATLQTWKDYGLFAHSGMDTILGKGKKDLSTLMTQVCAARYLKKEGKLAFLVTQSIFKSGGAAEGFRRFKLPQGIDMQVLMAEDLSRINPFEDAANRTAIIYLQKDKPTVYPIPYILWKRSGTGAKPAEANKVQLVAEPVDLMEPASPWLTCPADCMGILRKILGHSRYHAHEGANTGGANGILWVEVLERQSNGLVKIRNMAGSSRTGVNIHEAWIEENLIYPLLKGKDLTRWHAEPSAGIILCQDPLIRKGYSLPIMTRTYPRTLEYLHHFQTQLAGRAAYRRYFKDTDPFYSMFDVGEYTIAPIKVVWSRFGNRMQAAVLEDSYKPVIPQETHCLVVCSTSDEAWYLAGLLNSLPVEFALQSYAMVGGKSFASPNLFNYVNFPNFEGSQIQLEIAAAARRVATSNKDQSQLDHAAARIYNIFPEEFDVLVQAWSVMVD